MQHAAGPDRIPANPLRAVLSAALWRASAHLALDAVMAAAAFVTLGALAGAILLIPLWIGVPLTVRAGQLLFRLGAAERGRFAATRGLTLPAPPTPPDGGSWQRTLAALMSSGATWRQVVYFAALVPMSFVTFFAVVLGWAVPATLAAVPLYYDHLETGQAQVGPLTVDSWRRGLAVTAVAVLLLVVVMPLLVRMLVAVEVFLARQLLAARPDAMSRRVEQLTESRARVMDAAESERRRIERDLHDGAQQRLVAMSMTLGRLSSRLRASGDADALALAEEARAEARLAIGEIRDLTRGLHPPVLTDRGLDAALSAIAARSPVPVTVDVRVTPRPSATVEAIAYFVVTEALTNVAKHARATRAWVQISRTGDRLLVRVGDDGHGGADPAAGSGLAGLADRVSGVDGELRVHSPPGGPTVIEVELSCGS